MKQPQQEKYYRISEYELMSAETNLFSFRERKEDWANTIRSRSAPATPEITPHEWAHLFFMLNGCRCEMCTRLSVKLLEIRSRPAPALKQLEPLFEKEYEILLDYAMFQTLLATLRSLGSPDIARHVEACSHPTPAQTYTEEQLIELTKIAMLSGIKEAAAKAREDENKRLLDEIWSRCKTIASGTSDDCEYTGGELRVSLCGETDSIYAICKSLRIKE
jgi:hypothetical protein